MGAAILVEEVSTITAKGQTTVPKSIRQALGVDAGDQIAFQLDKSGGVTLRRAQKQREDDPAMTAFLTFLARDIERNPGHVASLSPTLISRIDALVKDIEIDTDDPIEGDVAL
jgi:antitoxin PrlF